MSVIGTVESLWRYPVKSMRGEELSEALVTFGGVFGDRLYAIQSAAQPKPFPYLTARELSDMLRYQPRFRIAAAAAQPANFPEAGALSVGLTPLPSTAALDVKTPAGEVFAIEDPALLDVLKSGLAKAADLTLLRSDRAMTDCRPVSIFSIQTASQIAAESNTPTEKRRYRANIYVDLANGEGFGEDKLVGETVQIGDRVTVTITGQDPRCKMITLDPDTGEATPEILKQVSLRHEINAGVYGAVLVEGMIKAGDEIVIVE